MSLRRTGSSQISDGVLAGRLPATRLARRAARGDRRAFEQIYERFHQELYRYCLAILRDREDAEDALQATMAAALRALPGERREVALRPWLYRVAHNEAISTLRARRSPAQPEEVIPEASASAEAELAARDRLRGLVADLRALPDRQRSALVMRELSGLSYGEIGAALSSSEGGAKQTVHEARSALREMEEGRAMECEVIREALSARDGRRLRGRRVRAHLGSCDGCRGFQAAIFHRRADLQALCPPLPAIAAASVLSGLLGGSSSGGAVAAGAAGGGGAAGALGGGLAGSAALKGASIAATVVVAAGAADLGGLIDLPIPVGSGGDGGSQASGAPGGVSSAARRDAPAADGMRRREASPRGGARSGQGPAEDSGKAPAANAGAGPPADAGRPAEVAPAPGGPSGSAVEPGGAARSEETPAGGGAESSRPPASGEPAPSGLGDDAPAPPYERVPSDEIAEGEISPSSREGPVAPAGAGRPDLPR